MTTNLPDIEKAGKIKPFSDHLELAKSERKVYMYNDQCKSCDEQLSKDEATIKRMHYSFDYAQQIHFPSSPQQPGSYPTENMVSSEFAVIL